MQLASGSFISPSTCTVVLEKFQRKAVVTLSSDSSKSFSLARELPLRVPSPSGELIFFALPGSLTVMTVGSAVVRSIETKITEVCDVSWSADEQHVAFTAMAPKKADEYDLNAYDWSGDRGEGFSAGFPTLFVWNFASSETPREIKQPESETGWVTSPCFVGARLFAIVLLRSLSAPQGVKYCTNRPGFVAEIELLSGNVRELPNTRGVGLECLKAGAQSNLLFWLTASSSSLHKSSRSLFGMVRDSKKGIMLLLKVVFFRIRFITVVLLPTFRAWTM